MNYIPQMYKAIVPLAVAALLSVLAIIGVTPQMTIEEAVTFIVTAGLVWLVPNKKG